MNTRENVLHQQVRSYLIDGRQFILEDDRDVADFNAIKDGYPRSRSSSKTMKRGTDMKEVVVHTFPNDVIPKQIRKQINDLRTKEQMGQAGK